MDTLAVMFSGLESAVVMRTACLLPLIVFKVLYCTKTQDQSISSSTSPFEILECLYKLEVVQKDCLELQMHFEICYDVKKSS